MQVGGKLIGDRLLLPLFAGCACSALNPICCCLDVQELTQMLFIEAIYFGGRKVSTLVGAPDLFHQMIDRRIILPACWMGERDRDNLEGVAGNCQSSITMQPWLADDMLDRHFFLKLLLHLFRIGCRDAEDAKLLAVREHHLQ